jgi:hypothetical protein
MRKTHQLDDVDLVAARLQREWRITIQCPLGGTDLLIEAFGREFPLQQGAYDHCMYIRKNGGQTFRALEGSHAGNEGTMQNTACNEIVFTIPAEINLLRKAFGVLFEFGIQEDPTVHIEEIRSSQSYYLDDTDNPNRYWNRDDADEIHGKATASHQASQDESKIT